LLILTGKKQRAAITQHVRLREAGWWAQEEFPAGARQGADMRVAVDLGEQCSRTAGAVEARLRFALQQDHATAPGEIGRDTSAGDAGPDDDDIAIVIHAVLGQDAARGICAGCRNFQPAAVQERSCTWGMISSSGSMLPAPQVLNQFGGLRRLV
jgi:hypothetical protein